MGSTSFAARLSQNSKFAGGNREAKTGKFWAKMGIKKNPPKRVGGNKKTAGALRSGFHRFAAVQFCEVGDDDVSEMPPDGGTVHMHGYGDIRIICVEYQAGYGDLPVFPGEA